MRLTASDKSSGENTSLDTFPTIVISVTKTTSEGLNRIGQILYQLTNDVLKLERNFKGISKMKNERKGIRTINQEEQPTNY